MNEDRLIDHITGYFDNNTDFHTGNSVSDVETVFRKMEAWCAEQGVHFESELESDDFEELDVSEEEDRTEVKFEIPIVDHDLVLEFFYFRSEDNLYHINLDVDYYFPQDEDEADD